MRREAAQTDGAVVVLDDALHTRQLPRATEVAQRLFLDAEEVTLVSDALTMTVWSSPQRKAEQGEQAASAPAHLNIDLDWAKGKAKGLVAELSGERDMSRAARLLLKPPPGELPGTVASWRAGIHTARLADRPRVARQLEPSCVYAHAHAHACTPSTACTQPSTHTCS